MNENKTVVLLGFLDESITEKHREQLDYTVNKIGGVPDFPDGLSLEIPKCPMCHLQRPLVIQIYAPLENSMFHRTLYLFGCINPSCWQYSESWLCLRVQTSQNIAETSKEQSTASDLKNEVSSWCTDADNWDTEDNINIFESNTSKKDAFEARIDLEANFANISMNDEQINGYSSDDVVKASMPKATAEIKTPEAENMVFPETPTLPEYNVAALLHEATPLPTGAGNETSLQFVPYFMSVWPEDSCSDADCISVTYSHVKDLLEKYEFSMESSKMSLHDGSGATSPGSSEIPESYESSCPAHGDKMFYQFLSRIQISPEQILRYSRNSTPLLLYPLQETTKKCKHCDGVMIFEFQLVPTIISKMWLNTDDKQVARLDFGTILVYTCKDSCWSADSKIKIESVTLQKEIY